MRLDTSSTLSITRQHRAGQPTRTFGQGWRLKIAAVGVPPGGPQWTGPCGTLFRLVVVLDHVNKPMQSPPWRMLADRGPARGGSARGRGEPALWRHNSGAGKRLPAPGQEADCEERGPMVQCPAAHLLATVREWDNDLVMLCTPPGHAIGTACGSNISSHLSIAYQRWAGQPTRTFGAGSPGD